MTPYCGNGAPQPSANHQEDNMRGRVALVTGASSGIGRATVVELRRRGARVMAVARREHLLAQLASETGAAYVACSLETRDGCEQAIEATRSQLGPVEILVNNAALGTGQDGSVLDLEWDTWRRALNLDLDVPFLLTKLAAADMMSSGWGRIIMVSSTAGQVGGAQMAAYCAAKHGLLGLMRATAVDLAHHQITCNAVLPGWVRTEMSERSAQRESAETGVPVEQIWAERARSYPAGRTITPAEVAAAIAFLASEEASGVNGQALAVALGGLW
jgi:NAD(P)-dependent dehydrogenase (short-subunit alcohol dehydrogenase family)